MNISSELLNFGLTSVASFHDFKLVLDVRQRGTNRGRARCPFLQLLYLTLKKPKFF